MYSNPKLHTIYKNIHIDSVRYRSMNLKIIGTTYFIKVITSYHIIVYDDMVISHFTMHTNINLQCQKCTSMFKMKCKYDFDNIKYQITMKI